MSVAGSDLEEAQPLDPEAAPPRRRSPLVYLVPLILFAGLSIVFGIGLFSGDASRVPSALIGRVAPAIALTPIEGLARDGQPVPAFGNGELGKGRATIVNVFASWCAPCKVEHPVLMGLAQSEAVRQGKVALVGMNYKDEGENARRFLGALGNPFSAVGADPAGRSAIEWGVYGVPETFLIGPDGSILDKHVGPLDQAAASRLLQRALKGV